MRNRKLIGKGYMPMHGVPSRKPIDVQGVLLAILAWVVLIIVSGLAYYGTSVPGSGNTNNASNTDTLL